MKRRILFFLFCMVSFGFHSLGQWTTATEVGFTTKVGERMPDFKVQMLDGTMVDTETLRGKVGLLNFWGAKCGGCLLELKRFPKEIIKPYGNRKDFYLLPIEAQLQPKEVIETSAKRMGFTFPLAYENGKDIAGLFFERVYGIPRTLIIDRKGVIVYQAFGYTEEEFEKMLKVLEKTLNAGK